MDNALAAAAGDVSIRVEARALAFNGSPKLEIRVRDNGPGLSPDEARRVFEPFFTTKSKGTGLGLAIVKRIVEDHGGTIKVGGNGPPGAEFIILLPRELQ